MKDYDKNKELSYLLFLNVKYLCVLTMSQMPSCHQVTKSQCHLLCGLVLNGLKIHLNLMKIS